MTKALGNPVWDWEDEEDPTKRLTEDKGDPTKNTDKTMRYGRRNGVTIGVRYKW
jgi:hypothetical protein